MSSSRNPSFPTRGMRVLQHTSAACVRVAALASTARPTRLAVVRPGLSPCACAQLLGAEARRATPRRRRVRCGGHAPATNPSHHTRAYPPGDACAVRKETASRIDDVALNGEGSRAGTAAA
jgi:hypothetical protein